MEDSEISVENTNMPGQWKIKKDETLGLLKTTRMDKSPGPDGIYPRLLREENWPTLRFIRADEQKFGQSVKMSDVS